MEEKFSQMKEAMVYYIVNCQLSTLYVVCCSISIGDGKQI